MRCFRSIIPTLLILPLLFGCLLTVCSRVPERYLIASLCYLAIFVSFMLRFCLAIIIAVLVQPCFDNDAVNYDCGFDQDTDDCSIRQVRTDNDNVDKLTILS